MKKNDFQITCPIPLHQYPQILMAHGGGGSLMQDLIQKVFLAAFENPFLAGMPDAAALTLSGKDIAFTTDSFVVQPLFFPGGDIGSLAVHGTVNDLATTGARPLYLSVGFILEEGLSMDTLWRVALSMREAAQFSGVQIVTGDTKVVNKGKGDGIFINTSGVGILEYPQKIAPNQIQAGDAILLSGDLGRHGMAIMAAREGLEFETTLQSDSAPLAGLVQEMLQAGLSVHCLRDLTRGGLASALVELSEVSKFHFEIEERIIPVEQEVRGACELLGLDPLYVANEGRMVVFLPEREKEAALEIMRKNLHGKGAVSIGRVLESPFSQVTLKGSLGVARLLDRLSGEQLPRIC